MRAIAGGTYNKPVLNADPPLILAQIHQPPWDLVPDYLCLFDSRSETRRDIYATFLDYFLAIDSET